MNQPTSRTPGPWIKDRRDNLCGSDGKQIMVYNMGIALACSRVPEAEANAAYIVEAVNGYEALRVELEAVTAKRDAMYGLCIMRFVEIAELSKSLTAMKASHAGLVAVLRSIRQRVLNTDGAWSKNPDYENIAVICGKAIIAAAKLSSAE